MYVLHAREEDNLIHDEVGMRHYLEEWSAWMGRSSSDSTRKIADSKPQATAPAHQEQDIAQPA